MQRRAPPATLASEYATRANSSGGLAPEPLPLRPNERTFVVGKTGAGKTEWVKYILRQWERASWPIVIIDPAHKFIDPLHGGTYAEEPEASSVDHPYRVTHFTEGIAVQIYLPKSPARKDAGLTALLHAILARGGVVIMIEDCNGVMTATTAVDGLLEIITEGRAKEIPMYMCGQRPFKLLEEVMSQSEVYVIFRLQGWKNLHRMSELTGDPAVLKPVARYHWLLYREGMEHTRHFAPLGRRALGPARRATGRHPV